MKFFDTRWHKGFIEGVLNGVRAERNRIIKQLTDHRNKLLAANLLDTANVYQSAINLIEGENK
jgi:hypothetical protein